MQDAQAKARACPECGDAAEAAFHPFCSKRCANVDLHRWLTGAYAIPAAAAETDDAEEGSNELPAVQPGKH